MTQSITQTLFFKNECANNMTDIVKFAHADTNVKGHGGMEIINNGLNGDYAEKEALIEDWNTRLEQES